jgi:hypothetical protein
MTQTLPHATTPYATAWRNARRVLLAVLTVWALGSLLYEAISINERWFTSTNVPEMSRTFAAIDVDDALFVRNAESRPTFGSTFFWWHHNWIGQAFPFYWRPLTVQSYWVECRLFGPDRFDRWQTADIAFHVLFACLLAVFAWRITGSKFAAPITVLAFTSFRPISGLEPAYFVSAFTTPAANVVLDNWKDQPEMWTGACAVGALLCALSRRWWAALALAAISVCYKESGWMTFPMLLACAVYTRQVPTIPRSVWIATGLVVFALIALRASAGHSVLVPHHDSGSSGGLGRYVHAVIDGDLQLLTTNLWPIPLFGFAAAVLTFLRRPGLIARVVIGLILFAAAGAAVGYGNSADLASGTEMMIDPAAKLDEVTHCFLYGVIILLAWRDVPVRRMALCLYVLVLLSAIPSCFVLQPNLHMLYLTNAFQSVLVAAVGLAAIRQAAALLTGQRNANAPVDEVPAVQAGNQ